MALHRLVGALILLVGLVGWSSTTHAQVVGDCKVIKIDGHNIVDCALKYEGATGGVVGGGPDRPPPVFRWTVTSAVMANPGEYDCEFEGGMVVDGKQIGGWLKFYFVVNMYRIDTGVLVSSQAGCFGLGEDPLTLVPPPPPSPAEIVIGQDPVMTLLPRLLPPPIGSPAVGPSGGTSIGALVQWQSVGWCDTPPPVVVDIGLRGWTAHAEMRPISAVWRVSGPEPFSQTVTEASAGGVCGVPQSVASAVAGGAGAPFRWTPHQAGKYTVTLDVTWSGTGQYTYLGQPAGSIDMGLHTLSSTVSQTVLEAQAVATGGG